MKNNSYIVSDLSLTLNNLNQSLERQEYLNEIGKMKTSISKKIKNFQVWYLDKVKKIGYWYLTNFYLNLIGTGFSVFGAFRFIVGWF